MSLLVDLALGFFGKKAAAEPPPPPPPGTDPTTILSILVFQTIVWTIFFQVTPGYLYRMMKPTKLLDGYAMREKKNFKEMLGLELTLDECEMAWCDWMAIGFQHTVGGIMALPLYMAELNGEAPTDLAWVLFVVAMASEIAFDAWDLTRRWVQQLFLGGTIGGWVVVALITFHRPETSDQQHRPSLRL